MLFTRGGSQSTVTRKLIQLFLLFVLQCFMDFTVKSLGLLLFRETTEIKFTLLTANLKVQDKPENMRLCLPYRKTAIQSRRHGDWEDFHSVLLYVESINKITRYTFPDDTQ